MDSFESYKKKLQRIGDDVLQRVVSETLNIVASFAHTQSQWNIRSRFVNRNAYTERSTRFYQAKPRKRWTDINAVTGSVSDYMDEQDAGGFRYPKSGSKAPVAALAARGGNSRAVIRKKYKAGQLGANQFIGKPKGGTGPVGVYERRNKNKRMAMIRSLEFPKIQIKETKWHRDAVSSYARRDVIEREFIRQASAELSKLGAK
jgi:hypothetical protein